MAGADPRVAGMQEHAASIAEHFDTFIKFEDFMRQLIDEEMPDEGTCCGASCSARIRSRSRRH